jgi:hypothetical protein
MLKEEIALLKSAKLRHYLLIRLLFYNLPVPIISITLYLCVIIDDPWLWVFSIVLYCILLFALFCCCFVMDSVETACQAMCEPLRELLEMAEAQEADRRDLQQEEEAIRRAQERHRYQEQIRQRLREMVGHGQDAEGLNSQNFSKNIYKINAYF